MSYFFIDSVMDYYRNPRNRESSAHMMLNTATATQPAGIP
jgi:hypothetical protein